MEAAVHLLHYYNFTFRSLSRRRISTISNSSNKIILASSSIRANSSSNSNSSAIVATPEQPGGKMVVELVAAFNDLTERMKLGDFSTSSLRLLFKALKLSIPILQALPLSPDGRSPLSRALSVAVILADLQAKRVKAIMLAAAELAALRLQDLPSANHGIPEIDHRDRVFLLLDKNGDGKISIEELMEVMEELGAQGEDAREMMLLLDSNSDGSLSVDEFDSFQKQVEMMRNLQDRDNQYKTLLDEKLQISDNSGLIET